MRMVDITKGILNEKKGKMRTKILRMFISMLQYYVIRSALTNQESPLVRPTVIILS